MVRHPELRASRSGASGSLTPGHIPVHIVAALARRQSICEIIEDYPILTAEQVEAAVEYAKVYPRTGRPLPTRSLKCMLRDLAAAGVWGLENDPSPAEPHPIP